MTLRTLDETGSFGEVILETDNNWQRFIKAVKNYFKNYFNFHGFTGVQEFLWTMLFLLLLWIPAVMFFFISLGVDNAFDYNGVILKEVNSAYSVVAVVYLAVVVLFTLIPNLSLTVRRLNDAGCSKAWIILPFILTWVGAVILLIILTKRGISLY